MADKIVDILLVEDRAEDAELAIIALEENRLMNRIKWVRDGQEALDFLFSQKEYSDREGLPKPRLVLLDLKMPKMDGIEVLKSIRSNPKTQTLPVVILTTSREEQDKIEAYGLGVNSYIVKPVEFDSFIQSVRDIGFYWLLLNEPPME